MSEHCCDRMNAVSKLSCDQHDNECSCPDVLISYNEIFDEYGLIIKDGGSSVSTIDYCPFCGTKLPESKRDLWFNTLEVLGFDDPGDQTIPEDFRSDKWYRFANL